MNPIAIAIAGLLLAGCIGAPPPDAPAPGPGLGEGAGGSNVSRERPPDVRDAGFAAANDTGRTTGGSEGGAHRHDLWGGKSRVTIFDDAVRMADAVQADAGGTIDLDPRTDSVATIRLPRGKLVLEGTDVVEVTLSEPTRQECALSKCGTLPIAAETTSQRHLWYRDPVSDWKDAGDVVWGRAFSMRVNDAKATDMPHASFSLWGFEVRAPTVADQGLSFHVRIELVRGPGEIALWPGHPDVYAGGHARTILQAHVKQAGDGYAAAVGAATGALAKPTNEQPTELVTWGTRSILIWANVTRIDVKDPLHKSWGAILQSWNASGSRNETKWGTTNSKFPQAHWLLRVGDDGMDSPYASSSRWRFRTEPIFEEGQGETCTGCAGYEMEYDLTIVATDLPVGGAVDGSV